MGDNRIRRAFEEENKRNTEVKMYGLENIRVRRVGPKLGV